MKLIDKGLKFCIIHAENRQAIDNTCVSEMAHILRRVTGDDTKVYPFIPSKHYPNYMLINAEKAILDSFGVVIPREKFSVDTVYILIKDNVVVLDGGERGRLYAIYEFAEKYLGVRFYLPEDTKYPTVEELVLEEGEYMYTPPFTGRSLYSHDARLSREWYVHNRLNGENDLLNLENYGGCVAWGTPSCHTSFQNLMPPEDEEYGFEKHPEYYAYVAKTGKRLGRHHYDFGFRWADGELCYSNPEVIDCLTERMKAWILDQPRATIFSLSQTDSNVYCECPACMAKAKEHAAYGEDRAGAAMLLAVNEVAKRIKAWQKTDERVKDRELYVETFAYLYGYEAPSGITLEDNVIVRICVSGCWHHQTEDEECVYNKKLRKTVEDWKKLSKKLYIWDYPNNHQWMIMYNTVLESIQSRMKFYAKSNVFGIFNEMGSSGRIGPIYAVKQYLYAKLMWDPNINLQQEYKMAMEYFFEEGAPYLMEIERRYYENVLSYQDYHTKNDCMIYKEYVADDFLIKATQLYELALKKVKKTRVELLIRKEYAYLKFLKMYLNRENDYEEMQRVFDEFERLEISFPKIEMMKKHYFGGIKNDWFRREIEDRNRKNAEDRLAELNVEFYKNNE